MLGLRLAGAMKKNLASDLTMNHANQGEVDEELALLFRRQKLVTPKVKSLT
jgi:hypothetical protein